MGVLILLASRVAEQYRGSPMAKQIERVFGKLAELLPDKVSINPALLFTRFTFTSPPSKPVDEKIRTTVVRGLLARHTLRIAYRTFDAAAAPGKESKIDPYHMANLQGEWQPQQKLTRRKNGDVELEFPAKGLFEVQRWVLSWGRWATVLSSAELANSVRDEIRAMAPLGA